jgi:hypothetical protein
MAIVEQYRTTDGVLELLVDYTAGDWTVGFAGVPSHTHGDILADLEGCPPETAVKLYVRDILDSNRVIVIRRFGGAIRDTWIADGPTTDLMRHADPTETIETRFWNGTTAAG